MDLIPLKLQIKTLYDIEPMPSVIKRLREKAMKKRREKTNMKMKKFWSRVDYSNSEFVTRLMAYNSWHRCEA